MEKSRHYPLLNGSLLVNSCSTSLTYLQAGDYSLPPSKVISITPRKSRTIVKMTKADKDKSTHSLSGHKRKDMAGRTYSKGTSGY